VKRYRPTLLVVVSAMELSWLYPWLAILGHAATGYADVLPVGLAFGLFFLALGAAELLSRWRVLDRYQQLAIGLLILLSVLVVIRAQVYVGFSPLNLRWVGRSLNNLFRFEPHLSRELFLLLATFVLWWRGIRTSGRTLGVDEVGFQFRLGVVLVIGLFVFQAFSGRQTAGVWMVSLFFSGLVAVALARIQDTLPAGQTTRPVGPSWLFFLLVGAGGTLSLGLLLSLLLTTETFLSRWLRPVFDAAKIGLLYLIFALSYVFVTLLNALIRALFRFFPLSDPTELETLTLSPPAGIQDLAPAEGLAGPPAWLDPLGKGLMALALAGIFFLLLLTVRRWRMRLASGPDVWRESVWSSREVGQGLLKGLQNNLRRLAGIWSGRERRRAYSLATVRKIYASLLALADRRGAARPVSQTPFEYLPTLRKAFVGQESELRALTAAYVEAHYGRVPDTEAELQALREAWQRIRAWAEAHPQGPQVAPEKAGPDA
jgi:hypothetical protein